MSGFLAQFDVLGLATLLGSSSLAGLFAWWALRPRSLDRLNDLHSIPDAGGPIPVQRRTGHEHEGDVPHPHGPAHPRPSRGGRRAA